MNTKVQNSDSESSELDDDDNNDDIDIADDSPPPLPTKIHGKSNSVTSAGNSITNTTQLTTQIKSTLDSLNSIELLLRNASDSETHHV